MGNAKSTTMDPPFAKGSETSEAAAESMKPYTPNLRAQVYAFIRLAPHMPAANMGATSDEVEVGLRMMHQTCSARVNELRNTGMIRDSGMKRPTRSGRKAVVYVAVAKAGQQ